jgi:2-succinyl-6-hydroxy-2,4-cyclohexadiene-1-carboxylate synthase
VTRVDVRPGLVLNVESWGAGPPLVLLHGFTGSAASWGEFGELLGRSFQCIAVDIVGHGQSDAPRDLAAYRMEQVAIAVACLVPAAVSALVTIGASPGLDSEAERAERRRADEDLADRIEREGLEAFVDYWESLPLWASQASLPAEIRQAQRQTRLANRPVGLANSLRGMGTGAQPSYWDRLPALPIPFLALAGELDRKYVDIARRMAGLAPRGRAAVIPAAGHAAQLEAPAAVAQEVTEFLNAVTESQLEAHP